MARGELVGEAFIRVTADTTAMRRAIKRAAKQAGADYTSDFGKEVERTANSNFAGARRELAKAITLGDFTPFVKQTGSVKGAIKSVEDQLADLRKMRLLNQDEFNVFSNTLKTWAKSALIQEKAEADAVALEKVREATRKARLEFEVLDKAHFQAIREDIKRTEAATRALAKQFEILDKAHTQALREDLKRTTAQINLAHAEALKLNKQFDDEDFDFDLRDAAVEAARFNEALKKTGSIQFGKNITEARVDVEKLRQGLRGVDALSFRAGRSSDSLGRNMRQAARGGDRMLSVFGGINKTLEGISHRGNPLVDLLVAPLRLGTGAAKLFETAFGKMFGRLAAGSRALGVFGGLVGSIGAAVVAMVAMAKAASLLTSALSLVGGMATLAASAIGGALVGALMIAASAIPAVIGGLGGLILFFADFKKEAPGAFKILTDFGTAFQKAFDKEAFRGMEGTMARLVKAITPLAGPLATNLGKAMNEAVKNFVASLTAPQVMASLKVITEALPRQVAALGRIFTNLATGLIGFFSAIIPYADNLLESLRDITQKFSDFTNSTKGRQAIQTFFLNVRELAFAAWRIIENVAVAIGAVFKAAVGDGNGPAFQFLVMIDNVTRKFATFLQSTEGQNKLKDWFNDALRAAEAVGSLIGGIGAIIGALDTGKSRDQVIKLTDGIGNFLTKQAPNLEKFLGFIDRIGESFSKVDIQPFLDLGTMLGNFITNVGDALEGDALGALDEKFAGFQDLSDTLRDDLNPALKDFLKVIEPIVIWVGSSALKNLASSFQGVAAIIDGLAESLAGFLNIVTGILTLDLDKIKEGWRQEFEGAGKILFGAFEAPFAGSGLKGIIDKALNIDSTAVNFDAIQTQVSDLFSGWGTEAEEGTSSAMDAVSGFFTDMGTEFTKGRLAVGQWFTDTFKMPDFSDAGATISQFFTDLGSSITSGFDTARLAVGQFFTDVFKSVGDGITSATNTVTEFISDLPDKIIAAAGQFAGTLVNSFITQFVLLQAWFNETFLPWLAALPDTIANFFVTARNWMVEWFTNMWNGVVQWWNETLIPGVLGLGEGIADAIRSAGNWIQTWWTEAYNGAISWWENTVWPWIKGLPERAADAIRGLGNWIQGWWMDAYNGAINWWNVTVWPWVKSLPGRAKEFLMNSANWLKEWFQSSWNNMLNWWNQTAVPWFRELPSRIGGFFSNLWSNVASGITTALKGTLNDIIRRINIFIDNFNSANPFFQIGRLSYLAQGGIVDRQTMTVLGEGGKREAVVPLDRPLSLVHPSVRDLAAFAQGKLENSNTSNNGRTINVAQGAIVLTMPYADPEIIASAVLDRIAAVAF